MRSRIAGVIEAVLTFGVLVRATAQMTAFVAESNDDQSDDESEWYGNPALLLRPPAGADVLYADLAGERVVLGMRETRWMVAMEEGDAVLRALGADTRAYVRLRQNGEIELVAGDGAVTELAARADRTDAEVSRLWNLFTTWTPVPNDGGAALKTAAATAVAGVMSTAADKVRIT